MKTKHGYLAAAEAAGERHAKTEISVAWLLPQKGSARSAYPMTTRSFSVPANLAWLGLAGLVVLPFAEFAAFFWVAARIGLPLALILLVATSFAGASLLRHQGGAAFMRLARAFSRGETPRGAARESLMMALGGLLMIIPGFVTDAVGFGLMLPGLIRHWRDGTAVTSSPERTRAKADRKMIDLGRDEWKPVDD
jgi:UPF0716 protein FxsA